MRYAIVIEKADGNYSAYVPDLPGCVATGDTVAAVEGEIREVLQRPKFGRYISDISRQRILDIVGAAALMLDPTERVSDCRDVKDNKYLELGLAAAASIIVSSDEDLLVLDPWRHSYPATGRLRQIAGKPRVNGAG